jgi:hypothetical protein
MKLATAAHACGVAGDAEASPRHVTSDVINHEAPTPHVTNL